MTDEQQPATPRPGPHLFGAGSPAVRPVPGAPGHDVTPARADPERAAAAGSHAPWPDPAGSQVPASRNGGLEPTGEPRVDEALAVLDELTGWPTGEQVAGYERVHRSLQDVLATVDDA
ncbi:hypothetical protein AB0I55_32365 [Actinocatenispora sera]|uniref:hypothetical protein n=1 Tax=Actinocatenispora sera TaxID=390989 RepID=UPI0033C89232